MWVNFALLCNLAQRLTQKARDTFGSQQAATFGSTRGESGAGFPEFGDLDLYG